MSDDIASLAKSMAFKEIESIPYSKTPLTETQIKIWVFNRKEDFGDTDQSLISKIKKMLDAGEVIPGTFSKQTRENHQAILNYLSKQQPSVQSGVGRRRTRRSKKSRKTKRTRKH